MRINKQFQSFNTNSKSVNASPDKLLITTFSPLKNRQGKQLLRVPVFINHEKHNKKQNLKPPHSFLPLPSSRQQKCQDLLMQSRNPEQAKDLTKSQNLGNIQKRLSFELRSPPHFQMTQNKSCKNCGDPESKQKEKNERQVQKANMRISASPKFFQNFRRKQEEKANPSNISNSSFSSKQQPTQKKQGSNRYISAVELVRQRLKKSSNKYLYISTNPNGKTKSECGYDHKENHHSKVPQFIKQKDYAKSQQSCESQDSIPEPKLLLAKIKSLQVKSFQKKSIQVKSQQNKSEQGQGYEIKITVKPAQKKRSIQDFILLKQLGSGSFGKAYLALQKNINFICVLKFISKDQLNQLERSSLLREVKIQSFLKHPNITTLYGVFDDIEYIYLILELLPSGNLKDCSYSKSISQKKVSKIISQICRGISYMHQNHVLHRDLKPENIFSFNDHIKLGDFGCAVYSDVTRNSFVGSPCYLSPEQLQNQFYDEKVDMWEIGTLTYELLFKQCPFETDIIEMMTGQRRLENLSDLYFPPRFSISDEAKDFISKALDKNPSKRMNLQEALKHRFIMNVPKDLRCIDF